MKLIKHLIYFPIFFNLHSTIGVMEHHKLYLSYRLPKEIPTNFTVPVSECVQSYSYGKDGNKTYIGFRAIDQFVYAEVNEKFMSKCIFYSHPLQMLYKNQDNILIIISGCLLLNGYQNNGTFVLMPANWTKEFLLEGLTHFNITQKFDQFSIMSINGNTDDMVKTCLHESCPNFKTELEECLDILSEDVPQNEIYVCIINCTILLIYVIVAGVWYRSD